MQGSPWPWKHAYQMAKIVLPCKRNGAPPAAGVGYMGSFILEALRRTYQNLATTCVLTTAALIHMRLQWSNMLHSSFSRRAMHSAASGDTARSHARPISSQWRGENFLSFHLHQRDQGDLPPSLAFLYLDPEA